MCSKMSTIPSTKACLLKSLRNALDGAEAVVVGAGAGLSSSAGAEYSGAKVKALFGDFMDKYGFKDLYSASFYDFATQEEYWAFWSRMIVFERYTLPPKADVYTMLRKLLEGKEYFVITTNVDHLFQRSGFDRKRLFYTQGDYGLLQCATPCHQKTYEREGLIREMFERQENMRVPSELVPHCPVCGERMVPNLRMDGTFVQDEGWYAASDCYNEFIAAHQSGRVLYLDLGSGANTPVIFKYPFMRLSYSNPDAVYACINLGEAYAPKEIASRSICIDADIREVFMELVSQSE